MYFHGICGEIYTKTNSLASEKEHYQGFWNLKVKFSGKSNEGKSEMIRMICLCTTTTCCSVPAEACPESPPNEKYVTIKAASRLFGLHVLPVNV